MRPCCEICTSVCGGCCCYDGSQASLTDMVVGGIGSTGTGWSTCLYRSRRRRRRRRQHSMYVTCVPVCACDYSDNYIDRYFGLLRACACCRKVNLISYSIAPTPVIILLCWQGAVAFRRHSALRYNARVRLNANILPELLATLGAVVPKWTKKQEVCAEMSSGLPM